MNKRAIKEIRSLLVALLLVCGIGSVLLLWWKPEAQQTAQDRWQDWIEGDDDAADADPERTLRVLFIGNSHTYANDMPDMIRRLARAAGEQRRFRPVQETPGGARLKQHWENGRAARLLDESRWDYVVLQEQQQFLSFARWQRVTDTNPYANHLIMKARQKGSVPLLFLTWARRDGDQHNVPNDNYRAMQARLGQGYRELAKELGVEVVPVGDAWEKVMQQHPQLDLWAEDGSHANRKGSYLAACTFYAVFYRQSPVGNSYTAGLAQAEARILQEFAAATAMMDSSTKK